MSHPREESYTDHLVRRIQDGDERAIDLLYNRYIGRLEGWAHGRVPQRARGTQDTQIVAHDVLMKSILWASEGREQIETSFRSFVSRVLRNRITDLLRGRNLVNVEINDDLPNEQPTDLERLIQDEFEEEFISVIRSLPLEQQRLLDLRFDQGLSYQEVAAEMGLESADAARMRVNRVLRKLSGMLLPDGGPAK